MNLKLIQAACLPLVLYSRTIYGQPVNKSDDNRIIIDAASTGANIPSSMYGIFFKDISHSGERVRALGIASRTFPLNCHLSNITGNV